MYIPLTETLHVYLYNQYALLDCRTHHWNIHIVTVVDLHVIKLLDCIIVVHRLTRRSLRSGAKSLIPVNLIIYPHISYSIFNPPKKHMLYNDIIYILLLYTKKYPP